MTAAMVGVVDYGAALLRSLYQRHLKEGFLFSAALHVGLALLLLAALRLAERPPGQRTTRMVRYADLGPPPSLTEKVAAPQIQVTAAPPVLSIGIPEPVPDAEVSPEATISTQLEMSAMASLVTDDDAQGSGESVLQVERPEPEPEEAPVQQVDEEAPVELWKVEEPPVVVKKVEPEYPRIAMSAGVEGKVFVLVLVGKDGKVEKLGQLTGPEVFHEAVRTAAAQWVFSPAIQNDRAVRVWVSLPFNFQLR
jgi:periplasmic protein TonB